MAVAGDAAVGDARGVKELGVDALVALAGALVAREAAFGRAPVEAVVVPQLVERPVVEPKRHVVFRAVCLLPALGHGVVDDLRDAWAGGVVYGHLRRGAQVVDSFVVLGIVSVVVHKVEVDAVRARCCEVKGKVVTGGAQVVVAAPCRARRVTDAFLAAAVPIGGHVHARLGLGRSVGLGYVEGRRGARGGVVPRDGEGDAVLACGGGVGVTGFCRDGDGLGRAVGSGAEGWGGVPVSVGVASADSVLTSLVPVDVAVPSSSVSAVAFVLVPSSVLPVSLLVASACACCSVVARGWMASAMAAMGIVAPTMDVHAIAQGR